MYRTRFFINNFDEKEIETYINSHENEFALGTAKIDTGRLVSNNDVTNEKQSISFGGFYSALLKSEKIVDEILLKYRYDERHDVK